MLNQTGVKKVEYGNVPQILEDTKVFFSMSCMVAATGVTADASGKKIIHAGMPLAGDLKNRKTAFTVVTGTSVAAEEGAGSSAASPVGVLFNDVDVTDGSANATVLVFGFINAGKIVDTATAAALTAAEANLPLITVVK